MTLKHLWYIWWFEYVTYILIALECETSVYLQFLLNFTKHNKTDLDLAVTTVQKTVAD